ncbi:ChaN family lipoprotein [Xylophilus sp. GOD-11R]|uniref:ChaN family lipoprotein n=1 Tax=Xylophilus sp. GOD-11R TaxID=3089814 RepID=UPI00298BFC86|nr:ChaN family lipoprotein [Xylophilus sp. GOD-11R]WPB56734.1 ChaN family lipoprotein [Xylophilus sp. GOD-11R]
MLMVLASAFLAACATPNAPDASAGKPDILLFGERHDAPGQVTVVVASLNQLANAQHLSALVLEMAPAGTTTVALGRDATPDAIRQALRWSERSWPWERYAPAITAMVAAGIPVIGANLPQDQMAAAMADVSLDAQLPASARERLSTALREGHCGLLPESRLPQMLRIQIARDRSMAHALAESAAGGRTAVLLAGSGHVDAAMGVPQHLPTQLRVRAIALVADGDVARGRFDELQPTPPAPAGDPCAGLATRLGPKPAR